MENLEYVAVFTAFLYVIFAARENILCWPAALISTLLYTIIFFDVYLWMDSVLQVYYMAMAIYGWYCWSDKSKQSNDMSIEFNFNGVAEESPKIHSLSLKTHIRMISILSVVSLLIGFLMSTYTPTDFPYVDAATTVFAIYATYLVTQKVLENWLYWIVIDFVSIYLYIAKGLAPTAILFVLYVIIAIYGYFTWKKSLALESTSQQLSS